MNAPTPTIQPGARATLHLSIRLQDGTVALDTFEEEPLSFRVGNGTLVPELEGLLGGLRAGDETNFLVDGSDLYGPRVSEKIHWMDASDFPAGMHLAPGQMVAFETPGGHEMAGVVLAVGDEGVQVDFNHPLAGRSLQIRVQVLDVEPAAH
jgi:FKBP-type peptidyl-prolyl cis-trans isomerase SlpA